MTASGQRAVSSLGVLSEEQAEAALLPVGPDAGGVAGRGADARAYAVLRAAIVRGRLAPGTVLAEADLAEALGISRTPVRAVLQTLLSEHLVELGPRRQMFVRRVAAEQRREVFLLRESLEQLSVSEACRLMTSDEIDGLYLLLRRQRRKVSEDDVEAFIDLDDQFHLGIARGARLSMLERFLDQIRGVNRLMGLRAVTREGRVETVIAEHERIVVALEARNAKEARAAMASHLANTRAVLSALEDEVPPSPAEER
jgi:DNA-binding GntR family transcriptional regulator